VLTDKETCGRIEQLGADVESDAHQQEQGEELHVRVAMTQPLPV